MMVVQENGNAPRAAGNPQGVSAPLNVPGLRVVWQPIAMAAALLFGIPVFSFAQIVPTPGTSTHVIQTQNGIPQVNIAAPSGAGVSVNTYNQFDVQKPGAILNNSPTIVNTQQAGMINGNPNFGAGQSARIIVNQVNSNAPSQLRGYVEVGGNRAEVILSNSAGIQVDGGGFINTSRAVLTTGTPYYGADGSLGGFNVSRGLISVSGSGLNASNVDQVDLISRAVQANAAIYAKNLNVVAGANQVNHDTLAATPIAGDGAAPAIAIDVSQLGGMYANRVFLVSNEFGVGVANAGTIAAQAGDLTLQSNGQLVLTGKTTASGNLTATANSIQNTGTTYAQQNVNVSTGGALSNSGTLAAQQNTTVNAGSINSTGALGAGVNNDGSVGKSGDLNLSSTGQLTATGQNVAGGSASISGAAVNLAGSETAANGNLTLNANAGDLNLSNATTSAQGVVNANAAGALINDHGSLSSQGGTTLTAGSISNQGGKVSAQGPLSVQSNGAISNQGGTLVSENAMQVRGGAIANNQGTIQSAAGMNISGSSLDNSAGRVTSLNSDGLSITTTGQLTNAAGTTSLGAQGGVIGGNGGVTVQSGSVVNHGTVSAQTNLQVDSQSLDNGSGTLSAAQNAVINAGAQLTNNSGSIAAGQSATVNAASLNNDAGSIQANQLSFGATNLSNHGGTITQTGTGAMNVAVSNTLDNSQGGTLQTNSTDLTLAPATLLNDGGTILHAGTGTLTVKPGSGAGGFSDVGGSVVSNGQAVIQAGSWNNAQGSFAARQGIVASVTGNLANAQGLIRSQAGMSLTSGGALDNQNGKIAAGTDTRPDTSTLNIQAASIQNAGGLIADFGTGATSVQGGTQLMNSAGTITGNGDVSAQASSIINTSGAQLSGTNVQVRGDTLDNSGGKIGNVAEGDVDIATTGAITNAGGQIVGSRDLSVSATTLLGGGTYSAAHDASLTLQGDFSSTPAYQFSAGHNLAFTLPGTFTNSSGLQSVNDLTINAGDIVNSGAIAAGSLLKTHSNTLTNTGVMVGGSASLVADSTLSNVGPTALIGASDENGTLEILAHDIENRDDTTATDTMAQTAIYGMGKVVLAGGKDANGSYTNAARVNNVSALIQSGGDMELHADQVTNTRRVMTTTGYTNNVDPALLAAQGISMSGCVAIYMDACSGAYQVPGVDLAKADPSVIQQLENQIGGVFIDPPHEGQWNSVYQYTTYKGVATANTIKDISPAGQIVSGGKIDASTTGTLQNYWSNIAAVNGIQMPANYDADGWKASGQQAPGVTVTYSGQYHYNNYDNSEHNWTYSFCDKGCNGPADVRQYKLPDYQSTLVSNGTISGTGVSINNTAGNASIPSLGLVPGQSLPVNSGSVHGTAPMVNPIIASATAVNVLNNLTIPQGGLFKPTTAPNAPYVIETNPAFTNQKNFISSDYFFEQIGVDLTHIPKRLGDGFYEQQLVRNEITSLTGKAVLGPYTDTQSMYEALMAAGASLSKSLNLPLGMGLSPEQVSQLTSNVVIMQTEVVDGQSVLVPVVYLAKASQENWNGPLISANNIDLQNAQSFTNSGTIKAANTLSVDGKQIDNAFGALQSGGLMSLKTTNNIDLTSANVKAGSLQLDAGKDLILDTATKTVKQVSDTGATRVTTTLGPQAKIDVTGDASITTGGNFQQNAGDLSVGGNLGMQVGGDWNLGTQQTGEHKVVHRANGVSDVDVNQAVGSSVKVGGVSQIGVGGDLTAKGAQIDLGQGGTVAVKGNVTLGAASATSTIDSNSSSSSSGRSSAASLHAVNENVTGTTLTGGDTVNIVSGKDITLSGSTISLDKGNANLLAAGDVNVGAATETHEYSSHETHSHSGVVSGSKVASGIDQTATYSQGSTISADGVNIVSGKDINVTGSTIVGTNDVALNAAHDVNIKTSQDTTQSSSYYQKQESGLMTGGLTVSFGSSKLATTDQSSSVTNNASTVGSLNGNLSVSAGNTLHVTGSDLVAGKNLTGAASNIVIDSATDTSSQRHTQQQSKSGVTLGLSGSIGDAINGAYDQSQALKNGSGDSRATALHAIAAGGDAAMAGYGAYKMATGAAGQGAPSIGVQVSVGSSHSQSQSSENQATQRGSSVTARGTTSLIATGSNTPGSGNITVAGSSVSGTDVLLAAKNQIDLQNTTDTDSTRSSNSSSSASVGVSFGTNGYGISASMSKAHGDANSDAAIQNNSHVTGANSVTIVSGGDTNIIGSNVAGKSVTAAVGGNLNVQSVQDVTSSAAHQSSTGGGFSVSTAGGASASFSSQHGSANSNYAGVGEQAGIQAGSGGFDVTVKGNTDLKGAVIASTADPSKNSLTTGTLTYSDIENHSTYSADSSGFSAGAGVGTTGKSLGPGSVSGSGGVTPMISQSDSGNENATTRSGVSAGTINITNPAGQTQDVANLNRDTSNSNGTVSKTPDVNEILSQQSDLMNAGQAAGQVVAQGIAAYADAKKKDAQDAANKAKAAGDTTAQAAYQAEADSWAEGGSNRVLMHTAGGALLAGLGGGNALAGAAGAGLSSALAGKLNSLADSVGDGTGSMLAGNILSNVLAGAGGALIGGTSGAFTASNADLYNRSTGNDKGTGGTGSEFLDRLGDALLSTAKDPLGALNYALNSLIPAPSRQKPDADANPLVQANDNGKPPATGGAVVTPPTMICTPNGGCVATPAIAVPGTPGYASGNTTLNSGSDDNNGQASSGGQSDASLPMGGKGKQFNQPKNPAYQPTRNTPANIDGTDYAGHALDRMQDRGLTPSVIQNTIENGVPTPSRGGTTVFYDSTNNVSVVTNSAGKVITVKYGK